MAQNNPSEAAKAKMDTEVLIDGKKYRFQGTVDFSNLTINKIDDGGNPDPEPTKPTEGTIKPGGWGANILDKAAWKVVNMRDFPEQFKIVDAAGKNVATNFTSQKVAEGFIAYFQTHEFPPKDTNPVPDPTPTPEPGPTPTPGGSVTKDGVKLAYETTGKIEYEPRQNFRDDGKRFDFSINGPEYTNSELIGYFRFNDGKGPDDEVSGKMGGGKHSEGSHPKVYDMGVDINNGKARYRTEDKHPDYKPATAKDNASGKGIPVSDKFVGYRFVKKNAIDGKSVKLQIWQDVGNNESTTPANEWKLVSDWDVKDPLWLNPGSDHQETIRIDGPGGVKNLEWKWLALSEIKQ